MSGGFSFGTGGNSSGSSNLFGGQPASSSPFGQPATTTAGTSGGLFGGTPTTTAASSGGLFGGATSGAPAANPFGGASSQKPLFGAGAGSNPSSGTSTPLFGASTGNPGGSNASAAPATSGTQSPSIFGGAAGGSQAPSFGGGFSFGPAKKDASSGQSTPTTEAPAQGQQQSLFGNSGAKPAASGGLFGGLGGASTPAKNSFSFGTSTTPAGPPPADSASKPAQSLFGGQSQPASGGLFGAKPADKPATSQPASGGFSLGQPSNATATTLAGGLFGGQTATAGSSSNLFGGLGAKPATSESNTPSSTAAASAPKTTFSFGPSATSATSTSSTPAPAAPAPTSLFGQKPSSTPGAATVSNLFGGLNTSTPASTSAAPAGSAPAPSGNLFGGLNTAPGSSAPASSAPATTAASTGGLFGAATSKPAATSAAASTLFPTATATTGASTTQSTTATSGTAAAPNGTAANASESSAAPPLGASTAGPAPQLSRLKNKTMDEIITRWASDLSKYQKEFQSQADKVAAWDRLLVDNGDKIQKLYLQTFEAEKAAAEVERRLTSVENQQDELSQLLDQYEHNVDNMFEKEIGSRDGLQGPDQERERVYRTAERLEEKLEEMMKDLGSMIGEVNEASSSLTKTSNVDDPLSQIVRVLNGHLSQLQWIDTNAAQLQAKVAAAQKASQAQLTIGAKDSDAADEFYKSFMGGGRR